MQEPESISDLLAAQTTEALEAMLASLRFRITEIQIEMRMVERQLQKRRNARARSGKRAHVLKRDDVLAALRRIGRASPPGVAALINDEQGLGVTPNAVRNHLVRLVEDGDAIKHEDGTYSPVRRDEDDLDGNGQSHRVASGDYVQGQVTT
jgi:hypothetical protein